MDRPSEVWRIPEEVRLPHLVVRGRYVATKEGLVHEWLVVSFLLEWRIDLPTGVDGPGLET